MQKYDTLVTIKYQREKNAYYRNRTEAQDMKVCKKKTGQEDLKENENYKIIYRISGMPHRNR